DTFPIPRSSTTPPIAGPRDSFNAKSRHCQTSTPPQPLSNAPRPRSRPRLDARPELPIRIPRWKGRCCWKLISVASASALNLPQAVSDQSVPGWAVLIASLTRFALAYRKQTEIFAPVLYRPVWEAILGERIYVPTQLKKVPPAEHADGYDDRPRGASLGG